MDIITSELYQQADGTYTEQVEGLGNLFKKIGKGIQKAATTVVKVTQKIDPVSALLAKSDIGKSTIGKILVPSAIKVKPVQQTTFTDDKLLQSEKILSAEQAIAATQSQRMIEQADAEAKKKNMRTILIIGGAVVATGILLYAASGKKKKSGMDGVKSSRKKRRRAK
jgi:hypothetical protein